MLAKIIYVEHTNKTQSGIQYHLKINVSNRLSLDDLSIGETSRNELRRLKSYVQREAILGVQNLITSK